MRTLVFDLDGTLVDSAADMIAAANAALADLGHGAPLDPVTDAATAFRGGRAMLTLGLSRVGQGAAGELEAGFARFLRHYAQDVCRESRFYPGARAALARLRAGGSKVAICTNKPEGLTLALLEALEARALFDAVIAADTLPVRKPDPAPYRAAVERAGGALAGSMMLGDTETDLATARAAGVPCALVTFGPGAEAVAALTPDAMLDDFAQLEAVAEALLG